MKILVSAYACEPGSGSEPGAGWSWTRQAAMEGNDVWLLTRNNNRERIERAVAAEGLPIRVYSFDLNPRLAFWKRGQRRIHIYYALWQAKAYAVAKRLCQDVGFDVVHHLTFASDSMPAGVLFSCPQTATVWGPVGGFDRSTFSPIWRWLGLVGAMREWIRQVASAILRASVGAVMAERATIVVAQNREVVQRFSDGDPVLIPNICLSDDEIRPLRNASRDASAIVFAGRLVPTKGAVLAVESLRELDDSEAVLHIYGDGPDLARCIDRAKRTGIRSRVHFHGWQPRSYVLAQVARAGCLVIPSFRDSAGWAVAEALALGTPVVCLDVAGPATVLNGAKHLSGEAVPFSDDLPNAIAAAIEAWLGRSIPYDDRFLTSNAGRRLSGLYTQASSRKSDERASDHPI